MNAISNARNVEGMTMKGGTIGLIANWSKYLTLNARI
jgi:hypothetical protein